MSVSSDIVGTLRAEMHGNIPIVHDARGNGDGKVAPTMVGDHNNRITDYTTVVVCEDYVPEISHTLRAKSSCAYREDAETYVVTAVDCRNATENPCVNGTLQAASNGGYSLNKNMVVRVRKVVRRLTPLECERLQGYPDGWVDTGDWIDSKGKKHKEADSPKYKALGNSIAIPFWAWLMRRISAQYERPATLGSLFDGIGGFPLCWERCNGPGTAIWASEIEEFPIAVTKKHFPEREDQQ